MPTLGDAILFIDGLGSSSSRISTRFMGRESEYVPWLPSVPAQLTQSEERCGFSYARPGKHYGPRTTNIPLDGRGRVLFRRYAPTLGRRTTYVAFSFGCPLTVLGLGEAMTTPISPGTVVSEETCPTVVLVQPAFALTSLYLESARATEARHTPTPLRQYLRSQARLWAEQLAVIGDLTTRRVRVVIVYWRGDRVLSFDDEMIAQLQAKGAITDEQEVIFPAGLDPFQEHCMVRSHDVITKRIFYYLQGSQV